MKSIVSYLNEGLFRNIGSNADDIRDWFMEMPVFMEQYNTKYDIRSAVKDPSRLRIVIGNDYKRLHQNRNLVIDLSPYMGRLANRPLENCMLLISTGLWGRKYNDDKIVIHNTEAYEKNRDSWGPEFDKIVMVRIYEYPQPVRWQKNSPLENGFQTIQPKTGVSKPKILLTLMRYVDDYPRNGGFPDDENASWWTETVNNL